MIRIAFVEFKAKTVDLGRIREFLLISWRTAPLRALSRLRSCSSLSKKLFILAMFIPPDQEVVTTTGDVVVLLGSSIGESIVGGVD